jgi:hypothetical protein
MTRSRTFLILPTVLVGSMFGSAVGRDCRGLAAAARNRDLPLQFRCTLDKASGMRFLENDQNGIPRQVSEATLRVRNHENEFRFDGESALKLSSIRRAHLYMDAKDVPLINDVSTEDIAWRNALEKSYRKLGEDNGDLAGQNVCQVVRENPLIVNFSIDSTLTVDSNVKDDKKRNFYAARGTLTCVGEIHPDHPQAPFLAEEKKLQAKFDAKFKAKALELQAKELELQAQVDKELQAQLQAKELELQAQVDQETLTTTDFIHLNEAQVSMWLHQNSKLTKNEINLLKENGVDGKTFAGMSAQYLKQTYGLNLPKALILVKYVKSLVVNEEALKTKKLVELNPEQVSMWLHRNSKLTLNEINLLKAQQVDGKALITLDRDAFIAYGLKLPKAVILVKRVKEAVAAGN